LIALNKTILSSGIFSKRVRIKSCFDFTSTLFSDPDNGILSIIINFLESKKEVEIRFQAIKLLSTPAISLI
jgi:S-adenosylmethionine hydrolase